MKTLVCLVIKEPWPKSIYMERWDGFTGDTCVAMFAFFWNLKDISSLHFFFFYLLTLVYFSLVAETKQCEDHIWALTGQNMCVLDGGVPAGDWREIPLFSFSVAWPRQVYLAAVPYSKPKKGFIDAFRNTSSFGDTWSAWAHVKVHCRQLLTNKVRVEKSGKEQERQTFSWGLCGNGVQLFF